MLQLVLAAVTAATPAMPATDEQSRAAVIAYIVRCEEIWAQAGMRDRSAEVGAFIADDYEGVGSRGRVHGKAAVVMPGSPPDRAAGLYYAKVRFATPTVAIARGEEWNEPGDGAGRRHLIWTDTWLLRDGRWRIVTSQDSVVPFDQPLQK